MKLLKIKKCSDPHLWYSGMIGESVPFLREFEDCYMSREPAGFSNVVRKEDAEVIDGPQQSLLLG
jgi:hypothetical protein